MRREKRHTGISTEILLYLRDDTTISRSRYYYVISNRLGVNKITLGVKIFTLGVNKNTPNRILDR